MSSKPSFPFLDGIRFVAALLVFTAHFFEFFHFQKINFFIYNLDVQRKFGATGVTIFFVLSGFLITYLLLQEQETKNRIAVKKFYLRRMLRIWPLYFFIVVLSFWVLNNMSFFYVADYDTDYKPFFTRIIPFYIILLPQVPFILYPAVPYANVLWSIGVEEVFYLFWPFAFGKNKSLKKISIAIVIGWLFFKAMLLILRKYELISQPHAAILFEFVERNRFYCFAIGGLAAYYFKYNHPYISIVKKTAVQLIAIIIIFIFLSPLPKGIFWGGIMHESVSVASAIIIIGCTARLWGYSILGSGPLRYLGKISYGVYCYHSIATILVFKLFDVSVAENTIWQILLYTAAMCTTVIMASISYYLLEKPFLSLKQKYY